jgi:predicted enzyme related to lactoylglutathione lyase
VPGGIQGGAGYRYWTITVSNLTEMVKACADAGAPVVWSEREIRPGVRIAMVSDPDGNWVEFLQIG